MNIPILNIDKRGSSGAAPEHLHQFYCYELFIWQT